MIAAKQESSSCTLAVDPTKEVIVRRLTESDLPAADELRRLAGWNQTSEKWRSLLRLEPHGCFAAEQDSQVVGTVTTITYGQSLAWIGMMLVHPDHRRHGIGTRLMHQALACLHARAIRCIKLDATPAGQPVYEKLGFVPESALTRWQRLEPKLRTARARGIDAANTRELADADWTAVNEIDRPAFGAARAPLLHCLAQLGRAALVWPAQGRVLGWGMLRPGANADYLGPLVCPSAEAARSLVAALLDAAEDRPVVWDILDPNEAAAVMAQRFGFAPLRALTRMRLGPHSIAGDPQAQFAIADPAVG